MMKVVLKKYNIIKDECISLIINSPSKTRAYVQNKPFLFFGFARLLGGPICAIMSSPES